MSRTERAFSGGLATLVQLLVQVVLTALISPLVIRFSGSDALGTLAIMIQVVGYLTLLDNAFSAVLARFLAQAPEAGGGDQRIREVMGTGQSLLLVLNVIQSTLLVAAIPVLPRFMNLDPRLAGEVRWTLGVLACWALLRTPLMIYGAALIAIQDMARRSMIQLFSNICRLLLTLALVYAGWGLLGVITANTIADAIDAVGCYWRSRAHPRLRGSHWRRPPRALVLEMARFTGPLLLQAVAVRLIFSTAHIVLGRIRGAVAVSVFYNTCAPANLVLMLLTRIQDNAAPAINELYVHGHTASLRHAFIRLNRFTVLAVLALVIGVWQLNEPLIGFWVGPQQYGGSLLTRCVALFALAICLSHVSYIFLTAIGEIRAMTWLALIEGFVNLGLSITLASRMGPAGVMLATVIANVPTTAYVLWRTAVIFSLSRRELFDCYLGRGVLVGFIGAASLWGLVHLVPPTTLVRFALVCAVYMVVYSAAAMMIGLSAEERQGIIRIFLGIGRRLVGRGASPAGSVQDIDAPIRP